MNLHRSPITSGLAFEELYDTLLGLQFTMESPHTCSKETQAASDQVVNSNAVARQSTQASPQHDHVPPRTILLYKPLPENLSIRTNLQKNARRSL